MTLTHQLPFLKRNYVVNGLNDAPGLSSAAHLVTENVNGLVVTGSVTQADGFAERETAKAMIGKTAPACLHVFQHSPYFNAKSRQPVYRHDG